jgi:hypothetical protein
MIWVSWRQHRSEAFGCLAVLIGLAIYAIVLGSSMRTAFSQDSLASCLARSQGVGCPTGVTAFMNDFGSEVNIAFWSVALIVPGLIGVLVGAPLIARKLEYGTWRLAWSQSVPRARWLAVKLAMVTGGLIVLGAAMTAVITWYRAPMDQLTGRLQHNIYDFEGLDSRALRAAERMRLGHQLRAADHRPHRRLGAERESPHHLPARRPVLVVPVHRGGHLRGPRRRLARHRDLAAAPARRVGAAVPAAIMRVLSSRRSFLPTWKRV